MEFNEVLALRKSVRRYTKEIVSQEDEKAMLDAAMASSVGKHNDGGYNLVVVRDREILDLIAKEEKEETGGGDPLFGAPLLFLICRTKEAVDYQRPLFPTPSLWGVTSHLEQLLATCLVICRK